MFKSWRERFRFNPLMMRGLFNDAGGGTAGGGTGAGDGGQGGDGNKGGSGTGQGDGGQQPGKTFTQEELDRIIADRLSREREKYKDYNDLKKAAEELKKIKEAQMSEAEKLQARLAELERSLAEKDREAAEAKLEVMKLRILEEVGLPKAWADRIFGTNEEELRADAKNLAKLLGEAGKTRGGIGSGSNPGAGGAPDPVEAAKKLAEERNKKQAPQVGYDPWATK
ncbi:Protein of unknown function DUF4355 [Moorella glycerini]|uniref:Phage minor structural protein GP20 n=1 Tax=Neomoorella stamsii TaxID=1266720 RepID=A0A9X7P4Y6_9FIRM|nr:MULTISPECIES: DUF4355 domain-containing protein [Moorella]PRR69601.1 hypothetical protein MOST_30230 [Moorella stamsii]CEP67875.1 Protein of unknown function DUF4355 [Moorella glycerini]CEP68745.1 Protein of unknown function DUF4355 [Moorella glycerini]